MNRRAYFNVAKPALKYRWVYAVLLLLGIAQIISDLAFAQTSRNLFDTAPHIPREQAVQIIIAFIVIIAAQLLLSFVHSCTESYLNESVVYEMRSDLLSKVQRIPTRFFDMNHSAKILNIFFRQLESVKQFVVYDVQRIIKLPFTFLLVGIYLFTVHPLLAITALAASALQLLSNTAFKKSLNNAIDGQRKVTEDVFHTMGETMQGIREIKINQMEDFIDERMKDCQRRGVKFNLLLTKYRMFRSIIKEIPMKTGYILGISIGIFLMLSGEINPGGLIAFITLLGKMSEPFDGMVRVYVNYQESSKHAQELLRLMQEDKEPYETGADLSDTIESIRFEDVTFRYEDSEATEKGDLFLPNEEMRKEKNEDRHATLENMRFEVTGGQTIALVGPSGAGKSTIIKLLYRFYDPQRGSVLINNRPLSDYNITSLRSRMSVVSQDVFIFDGTVRENLTLGRENISDSDMENALRFSQSYDFVQKLPEGLDTRLGERGIKLSQGQKQRISIARAIIKKAKIVILDEPTSALDVDTESSFQEDFDEWAKECTKIIIAHRLTTIRNADYILFLDEGHIAEQGPPYELLKKGGRFKEYWDKQFTFQENA
jgi:ABC-type multidrug transport system fused ATPase/permease subunit